jgi:hypothetical protein
LEGVDDGGGLVGVCHRDACEVHAAADGVRELVPT